MASSERPLLMIPGPIEISDAVFEATCRRPPSHVAPGLIASFGDALRNMRHVWLSSDDAVPFVVAGGGTLAMESAATNLTDCGEQALVINTGYFGDRMGEMLKRRGVQVTHVTAPVGQRPDLADVERVLRDEGPFKAVFATHVDTSTGVRTDVPGIAALAREHGALSCFDGVCATAAETFEMDAWGADVYLTASQKAIGLPAGLALWVASPRALAAREGLQAAPPMVLDWKQWQPIMEAYLAGKPSYFSTPATTLIPALEAGLHEIVSRGDDPRAAVRNRFDEHEKAAQAMRAAWRVLGLKLLPASEDIAARTLSALYYPEGVDKSVLGRIKAHGAIVAGGLHPACKMQYFRVGHMGETVRHHDDLLRTVRAVAQGLADVGYAADVDGAVEATEAVLRG